MRKLFLLLIVTFVFFLVSCSSEVEQCFSKTLELECIGENGSSYGTGFFINNEGLILTNKHLLSDSTSVNVIMSENEKMEATVIDVSKEYDLALLKIDVESDFFEFSEDFEIGEKVFSIGNPNGYGKTYYEGIISGGLKKINYRSGSILAIQTNIEIYDGCSGSPLYNVDGKVVGIMTFRIKDGNSYIPGLSYGIPSSVIMDFIEERENK